MAVEEFGLLLGLLIIGLYGVIAVRGASTDRTYNRNMNAWTRRVLKLLGAVDAEVGMAAADAVDGVWWDSSRRVPDAGLIQRRNFDIDAVVVPWTAELSGRALPESLVQKCSTDAWPVPLVIPHGLGELDFSLVAAFEVELDEDLRRAMNREETTITDREFAHQVDLIHQEAKEEFGELAGSASETGEPIPFVMSLIPTSTILEGGGR